MVERLLDDGERPSVEGGALAEVVEQGGFAGGDVGLDGDDRDARHWSWCGAGLEGRGRGGGGPGGK